MRRSQSAHTTLEAGKICKGRGNDSDGIEKGVCDADGAALVQRPDDKEEVIRRRLHTYHEETQPTIDHYWRQGRLIRINGAQTPEQVAAEIESKLGTTWQTPQCTLESWSSATKGSQL